MSKWISNIISVTVVLGLVLALGSPFIGVAYAENTQNHSQVSPEVVVLSIPVDTIVRGEEGSEHQIATEFIANGEYRIRVVSINQSSVHPNSNLVVRSGNSQVVVEDVESEAFAESVSESTLVIDNGELSVYVVIGRDKVFSGGMRIELTATIKPPATQDISEVPKEEAKVSDLAPIDSGVKAAVTNKVTTTPAKLPSTGAAENIAIVTIGSIVLGYFVHFYIQNRFLSHK